MDSTLPRQEFQQSQRHEQYYTSGPTSQKNFGANDSLCSLEESSEIKQLR